MLKQVLLVGLGGAAGSMLRFIFSEITNRFYASAFPLPTFIINILGCFLIGILINSSSLSPTYKLILIAGFCGGFTTFSAFAKENLVLISNGQLLLALTYTVMSCALGVGAVWLGTLITK